MDERFQMVPTDWADRQLQVNVCNITLSFKKSGSARTNYMYLTEIAREMGEIVPMGWKWSAGPMPEEVYEEMVGFVRSMIDEFIETRYGIHREIPY